jgi:hypothetical protein
MIKNSARILYTLHTPTFFLSLPLPPAAGRYLNPGQNLTRTTFAIPLTNCGTALSAVPDPAQNGLLASLLPAIAATAASGQMATVISNIIIVQMDPDVQEIWDSARKINCEWTSALVTQKRVQFEPFEVQMLDYEEVRFAGDSAVECWMDLQVGKFPDSTAVTAAVRIGQPLSMLVYAKDDEGTRHEHLYFCLFSKKKFNFQLRLCLIFLNF